MRYYVDNKETISTKLSTVLAYFRHGAKGINQGVKCLRQNKRYYSKTAQFVMAESQ